MAAPPTSALRAASTLPTAAAPPPPPTPCGRGGLGLRGSLGWATSSAVLYRRKWVRLPHGPPPPAVVILRPLLKAMAQFGRGEIMTLVKSASAMLYCAPRRSK